MNRLAGNQRFLLWIGIVLALIYGFSLVVLLGFVPPPAPSLGADEVAALYRSHNVIFRLGVILMLMSGGFTLPFVAVIALQMARHEDDFPLWSALQGLAGAIGAWIFAFPPLIWGTAAFSAWRDPQLTLLMHEFAWLALVTPISFWTFQVGSIVYISLRGGSKPAHDPFPRWIGYLTLFSLITGDIAVSPQLFDTGVFAWNGLLGFYMAVIVFTIWYAAICWSLFRAIKLQAFEQRDAMRG